MNAKTLVRYRLVLLLIITIAVTNLSCETTPHKPNSRDLKHYERKASEHRRRARKAEQRGDMKKAKKHEFWAEYYEEQQYETDSDFEYPKTFFSSPEEYREYRAD